MLRLLVASALPAALRGEATCSSDHLLLQVQRRRGSAPASEGASAPVFEPVDGGEGRVCRGAGPTDRGAVGVDYSVAAGVASLDECKQRCLGTSECQGVEYGAGRCEVWTRSGGITSASGAGYTCLRLLRGPSPFVPADGGLDRACRGKHSRDKGDAGTDYLVSGASSLEACKGRCLTTPACRGIEFTPGRCEVWTREGGIAATAAAPGHECHRYIAPVSTTTTTTTSAGGRPRFEPVDGGEDRACRGSGPRDAGSAGGDYKLVNGVASREGCKAYCAELGTSACKGIEYSAGRCEVWTRVGGIGATVRVKGFYCARYRPAPGSGSCGAFYQAEEGADLAGALIAAVHGRSPAHCCDVCSLASGCEGFAYVAAVQECYLKANVTGTYPKPGVIAQAKHAPTSRMPTCDGYGAPQVDRDVAGVELGQARAISSEYCCGACESTDGCQGFTYLAKLQMCYLKANVTGTYAHPGRVSQLRPMQTTPPPTARPGSCDGYGTLLRDTDVSGTLLAHVVVHTVDECCGACDRAAGCEGYAYLEEFKMCYLKASVTGTFPKQGPLARLRRGPGSPGAGPLPSCEGYRAAMSDTDTVGRLLGQVPAASPSQCCSACEEIMACEGFTFHEGACYLKAEVMGTYPHAGRVSRTKLQYGNATLSTAQATCEGYEEPQMGQDVDGALLKEVPAPSADSCCSACAAVPGCDGFSFLAEHGTCYLKAGVTGMHEKAGCVARKRRQAEQHLELLPPPLPRPELRPAF